MTVPERDIPFDAATSVCPSIDALERFATGRGPGAAPPAIEEHLGACPRCRATVASIAADNEFLAEVIGAAAASLPAPGATEPAMPIVEGYELIREIHRGAQGVVHEATQLATKRRVALKTLLLGSLATARQRARFEREVELVAALRHPNIVTLYESGRTSTGAHYLAMELVDGEPLTRRRFHELPVPRTLRMFMQICAAVNAAHQRGVIHRDLKPANILVDASDMPHVLDFGIAKALDEAHEPAPDDATERTMPGEFVGTFAYAAPEQVSGDPNAVDTRTDVYSLGVILYELLTGKRPYSVSGSMAQVIHAITHEHPPAPSSLRRAIDADVETIILKALAKDPARRYQSAAALAHDIELHLDSRPITARRDSAWYVVRTHLRRNWPIATVGGVLLVLVLVYAITMPILYVSKQFHFRNAQRTLGTFLDPLAAVDQETSNAQITTIPAFLAEASRTIDEDLRDYPSTKASLRTGVGLAYLSRDMFPEAITNMAEALRLREALADRPDLAIAESEHNLARVHWKLGDFAAAEPLYRSALVQRVALLGEAHEDVATTVHHLASTLANLGRYDESAALYRRAIGIRRHLLGADDPQVANSLHGLGLCLRDAGRHDEALAAITEAHEMIRAVAGDEDWRVGRSAHSLGSYLLDLGRLDEAERLLRSALRQKSQAPSLHQLEIARTQQQLARLGLAAGDVSDEDFALCEDALATQRALYAGPHPALADTLAILGRLHMARGDLEKAEAALREALTMRAAALPAEHWSIGDARSVLGECLARDGRISDAEPLLREGYEHLRRTRPPDDAFLREARERVERWIDPAQS